MGERARELSVSIKLDLAAQGLDPAEQKERLEQTLRFREELAEFCLKFAAATGLKMDLPVVTAGVRKLSSAEAVATNNSGPDLVPKKPRPGLATP